MKNPITNNTNNIEQKINLTELNQKNPSIINNTNYISNITLMDRDYNLHLVSQVFLFY